MVKHFVRPNISLSRSRGESYGLRFALHVQMHTASDTRGGIETYNIKHHIVSVSALTGRSLTNIHQQFINCRLPATAPSALLCPSVILAGVLIVYHFLPNSRVSLASPYTKTWTVIFIRVSFGVLSKWLSTEETIHILGLFTLIWS